MATLSVGGTTIFDGSALQSGAVLTSATFPAGHVVKVYNKVFKARQGISRSSGEASTAVADSDYVLIGTGATGTSGDPLEITTDIPQSDSSKFIINSSVHISANNNDSMYLRIYGGGAFITDADGLADNGNLDTAYAFGKIHMSASMTDYGVFCYSVSYLWSPSSASAQTISIKGTGYSASNTTYINEGYNDGNHAYYGTATSTLTVMEVA